MIARHDSFFESKTQVNVKTQINFKTQSIKKPIVKTNDGFFVPKGFCI